VACFRRSVAAARPASIDEELSIKQTAILTREKAKGYTALVLGLFDLLVCNSLRARAMWRSN
jgi:hypothetical protein